MVAVPERFPKKYTVPATAPSKASTASSVKLISRSLFSIETSVTAAIVNPFSEADKSKFPFGTVSS